LADALDTPRAPKSTAIATAMAAVDRFRATVLLLPRPAFLADRGAVPTVTARRVSIMVTSKGVVRVSLSPWIEAPGITWVYAFRRIC
jgi:hypothetical protein